MIQQLNSGFTAINPGQTIEVVTEVYDIGVYIKTFINNELDAQTTRKSVERANTYINKLRGIYLHQGCKITDNGHTKVNFNEKTLTFKIR